MTKKQHTSIRPACSLQATYSRSKTIPSRQEHFRSRQASGESNGDGLCFFLVCGFFPAVPTVTAEHSEPALWSLVQPAALRAVQTEEPCAKTNCKLGTGVVSTDGGAIFSESLFLMIYVTGSLPRRVSVGTVQRVVLSLRTAGY